MFLAAGRGRRSHAPSSWIPGRNHFPSQSDKVSREDVSREYFVQADWAVGGRPCPVGNSMPLVAVRLCFLAYHMLFKLVACPSNCRGRKGNFLDKRLKRGGAELTWVGIPSIWSTNGPTFAVRVF